MICTFLHVVSIGLVLFFCLAFIAGLAWHCRPSFQLEGLSMWKILFDEKQTNIVFQTFWKLLAAIGMVVVISIPFQLFSFALLMLVSTLGG